MSCNILARNLFKGVHNRSTPFRSLVKPCLAKLLLTIIKWQRGHNGWAILGAPSAHTLQYNLMQYLHRIVRQQIFYQHKCVKCVVYVYTEQSCLYSNMFCSTSRCSMQSITTWSHSIKYLLKKKVGRRALTPLLYTMGRSPLLSIQIL